jgi:hypothetical protein
MRGTKLADKLYQFNAAHGHVVTTALESNLADLYQAAETAMAEHDKAKEEGRATEEVAGLSRIAAMFTQAAQRGMKALEAWRELAAAVEED